MYRYKVFVNEVIDGDTIDVTIDLGFKTLRKERLRLYGINCPESKSKNLKEKKAGIKAKLYLKSMIDKKYILVDIVKQEKFGRYLANIRGLIHEEDIIPKSIRGSLNELIIKKGFAKEYYGEKRTGYTGDGYIIKEGL